MSRRNGSRITPDTGRRRSPRLLQGENTRLRRSPRFRKVEPEVLNGDGDRRSDSAAPWLEIVCGLPCSVPGIISRFERIRTGLRRSPRLSLPVANNGVVKKPSKTSAKPELNRNRRGEALRREDFDESSFLKRDDGYFYNVGTDLSLISKKKVADNGTSEKCGVATGFEAGRENKEEWGRGRGNFAYIDMVFDSKTINERDKGEQEKVSGWTNEQELALQKAYILAKPTPHFWKNVSKMVRGKSAQECFDKINSDYKSPSQPLPRTRRQKNLSPVPLSAGKVLKVSNKKAKSRPFLAQKAVRQLLKKHWTEQENAVGSSFTLEAITNHSTPSATKSAAIPQRNKEFLQVCNQKPAFGFLKLLPGATQLGEMNFDSPPVLKPVKNLVMHEKYIDQLHNREAKRKAASFHSAKSVDDKENQLNVNVKIDVKSAKAALLCNVNEAANQLKHLQASEASESLLSDDDGNYDQSDSPC